MNSCSFTIYGDESLLERLLNGGAGAFLLGFCEKHVQAYPCVGGIDGPGAWGSGHRLLNTKPKIGIWQPKDGH